MLDLPSEVGSATTCRPHGIWHPWGMLRNDPVETGLWPSESPGCRSPLPSKLAPEKGRKDWMYRTSYNQGGSWLKFENEEKVYDYDKFCVSIFLSSYISISLSFHLSIYLTIGLSVSLSMHLTSHQYPSIYPSINLSVYLSIHLSIYLSNLIYLYIYLLQWLKIPGTLMSANLNLHPSPTRLSPSKPRSASFTCPVLAPWSTNLWNLPGNFKEIANYQRGFN